MRQDYSKITCSCLYYVFLQVGIKVENILPSLSIWRHSIKKYGYEPNVVRTWI